MSAADQRHPFCSTAPTQLRSAPDSAIAIAPSLFGSNSDQSTNEMVCRLEEAGLLERQDLLALRDGLGSPAPVLDLVRRNKLTDYQAAILLQGGSMPLAVGDYVILEWLSQGGMSKIYKVRHRRNGAVYVMKCLPSKLAELPTWRERFEREAAACMRLNSPHLIKAHDSFVQGNNPYLILEHIDGLSLEQHVRQHGPMLPDRAVRYVLHASKGLAAMHSVGLFHRDVNPGNIVISAGDTATVIDLGLIGLSDRIRCTAPDASIRLTAHDTMLGTPDYMAPEQCKDARYADGRSDIYGLGCVLYFLLTGRVPYHRVTVGEVSRAHSRDAIPRLSRGGCSKHGSLEAVFQKMVAKMPQNRYQSMPDVLTALTNLRLTTDEQSGTASHAIGSPGTIWTRLRQAIAMRF